MNPPADGKRLLVVMPTYVKFLSDDTKDVGRDIALFLTTTSGPSRSFSCRAT